MKFKIGKRVADTEIEVIFDSLEEAADAINALNELNESVIMEDTKTSAKVFWNNDNTPRISEIITDNGERVALSLLEKWPEPKSNGEIVEDTGLSRATVYDQLMGRRGDKGEWFQPDGELYILTEYGEDQVRDLVQRKSKEVMMNG